MSARSPFAPMKPPDEPVLSVAELDARLRSAVQGLGRVTVEGEVTGFKGQNTSGHLYFNLKDERTDACVSCVMWRSDATRGGGEQVANGARVRVRGVADVYAPRGQLQLQVGRVAPAGDGDLLLKREALKRKLEAEGLFAADRKRKLPNDPRVIGVITSATGAVFHDIVKVALRRGAVRILLAPAAVQGDDASRQLRAALSRLATIPEVDVIIIGRGGGSSEDLSAFDDEALCRAIAACGKPVVAAVGHEVDTSLACLVADVRAATPSQAAELVVPDGAARRSRIDEARRRLVLAMRARLSDDHAVFQRNLSKLRAPERFISQQYQRIDDLRSRAVEALRGRVLRGRRQEQQLAHRLAARHPRTVLARARGTLNESVVRLGAAVRVLVQRQRGTMAKMAAQLDAISPLSVLARGYAIALHSTGGGPPRALRDARDVAVGSSLQLRLHHGSVDATVTARDDDDSNRDEEADRDSGRERRDA